MNRTLLCAMAIAVAGCTFTANAQKKAVKLMEQTEARYVEPSVRVYITPQVADMKMLSEDRETYGPYRFATNGLENLTQFMINEYKNNSLYRAINEADGDALIEPIYNVVVMSDDPKTLLVTISGYPVKYVNFHPLKDPKELETMRIIYTGNQGTTSATGEIKAEQAPAAPAAKPRKK